MNASIQTADTGLQARSGFLIPARVCRLFVMGEEEERMSKKFGDAVNEARNAGRPENAKVFVDDGHIVIRDGEIELYDFALADANTADGILSCLLTLSERQWCTPEIVRQFILVSADLIGIQVASKD